MMTYDDAMDQSTMVTVADAKRELKKHGAKRVEVVTDSDSPYGVLYAVANGDDERIAITTLDSDGMVSSADVMSWLGY